MKEKTLGSSDKAPRYMRTVKLMERDGGVIY